MPIAFGIEPLASTTALRRPDGQQCHVLGRAEHDGDLGKRRAGHADHHRGDEAREEGAESCYGERRPCPPLLGHGVSIEAGDDG